MAETFNTCPGSKHLPFDMAGQTPIMPDKAREPRRMAGLSPVLVVSLFGYAVTCVEAAMAILQATIQSCGYQWVGQKHNGSF